MSQRLPIDTGSWRALIRTGGSRRAALDPVALSVYTGSITHPVPLGAGFLFALIHAAAPYRGPAAGVVPGRSTRRFLRLLRYFVLLI